MLSSRKRPKYFRFNRNEFSLDDLGIQLACFRYVGVGPRLVAFMAFRQSSVVVGRG
jgi:hypothetical protein